MSDKPLPKMSYAQQEAYNALKAIDAASQPHQPGEGLMTTIARANLQNKARAVGTVDYEKVEQLRAVLVDFLNWYLWDHKYPGDVSGDLAGVIDNYLKERLK